MIIYILIVLKLFKIEHEDIGDELEGVISDKWVNINSSEFNRNVFPTFR